MKDRNGNEIKVGDDVLIYGHRVPRTIVDINNSLCLVAVDVDGEVVGYGYYNVVLWDKAKKEVRPPTWEGSETVKLAKSITSKKWIHEFAKAVVAEIRGE